MDATDWGQVIMLGDDAAMQWYVLTHPGTSVPAPSPSAQINLPGLKASANSNLLILGAIIVVVALIWK